MNKPDSDRFHLLCNWLDGLTPYQFTQPVPASEDASFRRYFRVTDTCTNQTFIIMDAPPDKEDTQPFVRITRLLRKAQVNSPDVLEQEESLGFLLLTDLGDQPYLNHLNDKTADTLYSDAIDSIIRMQKITSDLTGYDEQRLRDEMELFETWYVEMHLGLKLSAQQSQILKNIFQLLVKNALEQPQAFVHRDYHSRNLMLLEKNNPGVIDFQDAVIGAITYDLVSLFKDCYIEWPRDKVLGWLKQYMDKTSLDIDTNTFIRWFDLMGVQRHLKVLGIFARLNYRDEKTQYLNDLPLTLKYVMDCCNLYTELEPLKTLLADIHTGR